MRTAGADESYDNRARRLPMIEPSPPITTAAITSSSSPMAIGNTVMYIFHYELPLDAALVIAQVVTGDMTIHLPRRNSRICRIDFYCRSWDEARRRMMEISQYIKDEKTGVSSASPVKHPVACHGVLHFLARIKRVAHVDLSCVLIHSMLHELCCISTG